MRIAYVLGARPNFVKMAPVIGELRKRMPDGRHTIVHTGQHYDRMMSQVFRRVGMWGWGTAPPCLDGRPVGSPHAGGQSAAADWRRLHAREGM
jgi:hypothetical protein